MLDVEQPFQVAPFFDAIGILLQLAPDCLEDLAGALDVDLVRHLDPFAEIRACRRARPSERIAAGPYLQRIGANKPYEPFALSVIAFAITWGCLILIQLVSRFQKSAQRPD